MVGFGYDVHKLAKGESLILGGVKIVSDFGTVAHSDGDVLLHAISDAVLGAAGMNDIGEHFPDTDPVYKNADSMLLFKKCLELIEEEGLELVNIDATIVLEKPKISTYKQQIRESIANACGLVVKRVNIKATTNEQMGPEGRGEGVAVYSVCQLKEIIPEKNC